MFRSAECQLEASPQFSPRSIEYQNAKRQLNTVQIPSFYDVRERNRFGHGDRVLSVSFSPSPDSKCLASASDDGTVKLWDIESGAAIQTFSGHNALVWSVSFSPDGTRLASASSDGTVKLWEIGYERLLRQSCDWIKLYFFSHPEEQERLSICRQHY
ncbi:MAG: hypothetical protein AAGD25_35745 [Cyanobacteria bacterium P01_F01_bin.150]